MLNVKNKQSKTAMSVKCCKTEQFVSLLDLKILEVIASFPIQKVSYMLDFLICFTLIISPLHIYVYALLIEILIINIVSCNIHSNEYICSNTCVDQHVLNAWF